MPNKENLLFFSRYRECYPSLSKAEKRVGEYIEQHLEDIPNSSIKKIAEGSGSGQATVLRFCRSCGFNGLLELKISLKHESLQPDALEELNILSEDSPAVVKQKVLAGIEYVIETQKNTWNENDLERSADIFLHANHIIALGIGNSHAIARIFRDCMAQIGKSIRYESDPIDEIFEISKLGPEDAIFVASLSGCNRNILESVHLAHENGVKIVGITGVKASPLHKYLDVKLIASQANHQFNSISDQMSQIIVTQLIYGIILARANIPQDAYKDLHQTISRRRIENTTKY